MTRHWPRPIKVPRRYRVPFRLRMKRALRTRKWPWTRVLNMP